MDLSGNYEIVAISTDKNIFLMTMIIMLTLGNIFIKANVKTLVSFSTIDAPLGVPGVSKDGPGSTKHAN